MQEELIDKTDVYQIMINPDEVDLFCDSRKRILIIDDDQDFRLSLGETLVDEGYLVSTAKDAETGQLSLTSRKCIPDLIVLDLLMPGKSGIELRKELLQDDNLSQIPVIFLTGQGIVEGEKCVLKPYDERELMNVVRAALE